MLPAIAIKSYCLNILVINGKWNGTVSRRKYIRTIF